VEFTRMDREDSADWSEAPSPPRYPLNITNSYLGLLPSGPDPVRKSSDPRGRGFAVGARVRTTFWPLRAFRPPWGGLGFTGGPQSPGLFHQ